MKLLNKNLETHFNLKSMANGCINCTISQLCTLHHNIDWISKCTL